MMKRLAIPASGACLGSQADAQAKHKSCLEKAARTGALETATHRN
ncbi:hypothetical protein ACFOET_18775 [Parapedobacter deserti]|uniref:Uncharacterized protein n=1 Tax=Parapedobacter deserti TaxID=1912957 RepID=A0ABV7JNM7_9SPHI